MTVNKYEPTLTLLVSFKKKSYIIYKDKPLIMSYRIHWEKQSRGYKHYWKLIMWDNTVEMNEPSPSSEDKK